MPVAEVESRTEYATIRGVRYRLRHWGDPAAPRLLLVHGWTDISASFQFVADRLAARWHLIAPDWRGCGGSEWAGHGYAVPELALDLQQLLAHCFGDQPARLVGHSMGANVAALVAAAQPQRVAALAMLDAYGTPYVSGEELFGGLHTLLTRDRAAQDWVYADAEAMVRRLERANPRLTPERARFLARELGEPLPDGRVRMRLDPAWRDTFYQLLMPPALYFEAWRRIQVPVLLVGAEQSYVLNRVRSSDPEDFPHRLAALKNLRHVTLPDTGHNVHHDRPDAVAALLQDFFAAPQKP